MAHGYFIEAAYSDGHVLSEAKLADMSPYDRGRNTFHAICSAEAVERHGPMVRWSMIPDGTPYVDYGPPGGYQEPKVTPRDRRWDIDWAAVAGRYPDARPIYYREMQKHVQGPGSELPEQALWHVFGAQYTEHGRARVQTVRVR